MRRERFEIEGGGEGIRLHPESASEERLTALEHQVVTFALLEKLSPSDAEQMADRVVVRERNLYAAAGALIRLSFPPAAAPLKAVSISEEVSIEVPWQTCPLGAWLSGRWEGTGELDVYSRDGTEIDPDKLERLLLDPLHGVRVVRDSGAGNA